MIRTLFTLVGTLFWFVQPVAAASPSALLVQLQGEWRSDGSAFGGAAESEMVWAPALNGKFYRLDYRVAVTRDDGAAFTFEGVAHYQLGEGDVLSAYWADNSGDLHPIRAERDGDALIAHWGLEGAKQGRTRYELLSSGEIDVTDWIRTEDGWRQFNHNRFFRAARKVD
ncbi:hypothetical protein ACFOOP_04330 [Marinicaulis aureus]|uniref:DUF1579 domain-containing protein n=1 Tax=Hyphococcus aureus TaxID=2666033 RepID=A0ABW1KYD1_9PROT